MRKMPRKPEEGEGQVDIKIFLFGTDDFEYLTKLQEIDPDKSMDSVLDVIAKALHVTKEELKQANLELPYVLEMLEIILEANGLGEDIVSKAKETKSMIEKRKEMMQRKPDEATG